jgi:hypothetical protein
VYLPNWMPHVDFLRELRRQIAPRLVFGNGIRPGRAFGAFACDILGVECSLGDTQHRHNLDFYRSVAGAKPFLALFYHPGEEIPRALVESYVQRFVALGLSPEVKSVPWGRLKQRDDDLYDRFVPIYRRLDLAGWQPVTHLRLPQDEIWVERFGTSAPELYFTLFNPDDKPVEITIQPDAPLGLALGSRLRELVEGKSDLPLGATLTLPPATLRVLQVIAGP